MARLAWIGYFIFLSVYSWWKYSVAAPSVFSAGYAQSVAVLVTLTGVAPFVLAFIVLKALSMNRLPAIAAGVVIGTGLGVVGYALFWKFFIAPSGQGPEMMDVAMRGIGWGALQGGLAAIAANHKRK